jgi:hypothetical protein
MRFSTMISSLALRVGVLVAVLSPATVVADEPAAVAYGPCVCHSVTFVKPKSNDADTWEGATTRAIVVDLGDGATICYDAERLAVAAMWRGGLLDFSKTHHTSYKGNLPPRPAQAPLYLELQQAGWATPTGELELPLSSFDGYYLQGSSVVLAYHIAQREVLETPVRSDFGIGRKFQVRGGSQAVSLLVGKLAGGEAKIAGKHATISADDRTLTAALVGEHDDVALRATDDGAIYADIPGDNTVRRFAVWVNVAPQADAAKFWEALDAMPKDLWLWKDDDTDYTQRWTREITSTGTLGEETGAYTIDEIDVPEKPYGLWMRLSAIDFFADGRCAVATMPGDVWIVSWHGDDIRQTTWRRYATGLYEPLGLKIVDGKIYVRGRDRITRLHDLNDDGEADFYEQFHAYGPVGPGYHAFVTDLVRDDDGNFYYAIGGRKSPSIGEVVRVSPDGKSHEVIAEHFRCPNGMGFGGPHGWLTIGDNPDGKFPTGGVIVERGAHYGEEGGPRTAPFWYLLPPKVDTSSGSQCWADAKRFGPLSGALIHTSYSTSSISYVLAHAAKPHPSGFAVHLPFGLRSGPMRLAVSPRDGQMYIAGQRGWDSNAAVDGALSRLRFTGKEQCFVTGARATAAGVELTFSQSFDAATIDYDNFSAARVADKVDEEVEIDDVEAIDERTVLVRFATEVIDPQQNIDREKTKRDAEGRTHYVAVPPLAITFNIKTKEGTAMKETVYCTINGLESVE